MLVKKKYEIHWTNGEVSIGVGYTLNEALNDMGYSNNEFCYDYISNLITTEIKL